MNTAQIREHMKVIGSDRKAIGTVDRLEGDRIKLSKNDPQAQGKHHYIPAAWVERVDGDEVCLQRTSHDACAQWQAANA